MRVWQVPKKTVNKHIILRKERGFKPDYLVIAVIAIWVILGIVFAVNQLRNAPPEPAVHRDGVAAVVNGVQITFADIQKRSDALPMEFKTADRDILDQLINEELLLQEAEKSNITLSDQQLAKNIQEFKDSNGLTNEELTERLTAQNMTLAQFAEEFRRNYILDTFINQTIVKNIEVSDREVLKIYNGMNPQEKEEFYASIGKDRESVTLGDIVDGMKQRIFSQKFRGALGIYLSQLRLHADIKDFFN